MASKNSSTSVSVSDRYALALYDLTSERNCTDEVIKDLSSFINYNKENKDFLLLLENPVISSDDKYNIILKILEKNDANNILFNFIKVISKNKRFAFFIDIINRFKEINNEKRGNIIADITSAEELSELQKKNLINNLSASLGKKITLNYKVDKSIIGGLIIKVGSRMIDSSLFTKINKLKLAMKEV